jgi:hypothetical protein
MGKGVSDERKPPQDHEGAHDPAGDGDDDPTEKGVEQEAVGCKRRDQDLHTTGGPP